MMGSISPEKVFSISGTSVGNLIVSNPLLMSGLLFVLILFDISLLKKIKT